MGHVLPAGGNNDLKFMTKQACSRNKIGINLCDIKSFSEKVNMDGQHGFYPDCYLVTVVFLDTHTSAGNIIFTSSWTEQSQNRE